MRKYHREIFSEQEIIALLKTMVGGVKVYHEKFNRKFHQISMNDIKIQEDNFCQLRMMDPLLSQ